MIDEIQEYLYDIKRLVSTLDKPANIEVIIRLEEDQYEVVTKKVTEELLKRSFTIPAVIDGLEIPITRFTQIQLPGGEIIKFEKNG